MIWFPFVSAAVSLVFGGVLVYRIRKFPEGNPEMVEIRNAIQEGAKSFLNRQNKTVFGVALAIAAIIYFTLGWLTAFGFISGAFASALAGYLGMMTATDANSRAAEAARGGLARSFRVAFLGGSVTGFLVVGLALLAVSAFYYGFNGNAGALTGLAFGSSLISVFARLGGGIFTKAADVGTDLVGKMEAGIPEDDPRNPGVIADLVGDNVGDDAGMAADLFETYVVTLAAALLLAPADFTAGQTALPLVLGGLAAIASVVGSFFVRVSQSRSLRDSGRVGQVGRDGGIMRGLYKGLFVSLILSAIAFYFAISYAFPIGAVYVWTAALFGLFVTIAMVFATDYYTAKKYRPVQSIAHASESGHGTNVIMGLSVGMESTFLPIIIIVLGILGSFAFLGIYGVALAAVAMLSVAGIIVAIDAFGPITDNAGGIAEMTNAPKELREVTDALDAVGNTTKAVTKGYAIASAGLAALVLFAAYAEELVRAGKEIIFELQNPLVLVGLMLGAALPYLFGSIAMRAVGKTAGTVVKEIRRQFREIRGLLESKAKPEYGKAVDIVTKAALKEMIVPALLPIVFVLAIGFLLGPAALGGFLIGAIISGLFVALSMTSGGAAWDNAKKYIESAPADTGFGGKGSEAHKAAVTGDTVGDPYKDTAGPAINPLIKVVNLLALLLVPFL